MAASGAAGVRLFYWCFPISIHTLRRALYRLLTIESHHGLKALAIFNYFIWDFQIAHRRLTTLFMTWTSTTSSSFYERDWKNLLQLTSNKGIRKHYRFCSSAASGEVSQMFPFPKLLIWKHSQARATVSRRLKVNQCFFSYFIYTRINWGWMRHKWNFHPDDYNANSPCNVEFINYWKRCFNEDLKTALKYKDDQLMKFTVKRFLYWGITTTTTPTTTKMCHFCCAIESKSKWKKNDSHRLVIFS